MPDNARTYQTIWDHARQCQPLSDHTRSYQSYQTRDHTISYQTIPDHARQCQPLSDHTRSYQIIPDHARSDQTRLYLTTQYQQTQVAKKLPFILVLYLLNITKNTWFHYQEHWELLPGRKILLLYDNIQYIAIPEQNTFVYYGINDFFLYEKSNNLFYMNCTQKSKTLYLFKTFSIKWVCKMLIIEQYTEREYCI